jgi:hypothetical protein
VGEHSVDIMDRLTVKDGVAKERKVAAIPEGMAFEEMLRFMVESSRQDLPVWELPVVREDDRRRVISLISRKDITRPTMKRRNR